MNTKDEQYHALEGRKIDLGFVFLFKVQRGATAGATPGQSEGMANGEPATAPPAIHPIAALSFQVAKTMPQAPHEYVVRTLENEAAYVALFNLIVEKGVAENWGGRRYQYWYPGDGWKYWRMTNDIRHSRVLNRARADTPIAGAKGGRP